MNSQISLISAFMIPLLLLVIQGCSPGTKVASVPAPSNLEQINQQVRVVLLRASPNSPTNGQPDFVVTFGIEVPKEGAFSDLHIDSNEVELTAGGRPIAFRGETVSTSTGFENLPRNGELSKPVVTEGNSMIFEDVIFKALQIDAKHADLKILFSWRGTPMRFDFKNVPVGYHRVDSCPRIHTAITPRY
jgi:hypothetical protein